MSAIVAILAVSVVWQTSAALVKFVQSVAVERLADKTDARNEAMGRLLLALIFAAVIGYHGGGVW